MSVYTPTTWKDGQSGGTPINAASLNNMEAGITAANQSLPQYVATSSTAKQDVNGTTITGPCLVIVIDGDGTYQGTYYDDGTDPSSITEGGQE